MKGWRDVKNIVFSGGEGGGEDFDVTVEVLGGG